MRGLSCPIERTGSAVPNNNIALAPAMLTSAKALGRLVHQSFPLLVVDVAHQMMRRGLSTFSEAASGREVGDRNSVLKSTKFSSLRRHNSPRTVQGVWNARHGCYSGGLLCAASSASTPHSRRNGVGKFWMDTGIFVFFFFSLTACRNSMIRRSRFSLLPRSCISYSSCVSIHVETSICWHLTR